MKLVADVIPVGHRIRTGVTERLNKCRPEQQPVASMVRHPPVIRRLISAD